MAVLAMFIGDFIANNPGAVITAMGLIIGFITWLGRLEWSNRDTREDVCDVMHKIDMHITDADTHVNQLYIGSLKERIEKLEIKIDAGHKQIEDKMDKQFERLTSQINHQDHRPA